MNPQSRPQRAGRDEGDGRRHHDRHYGSNRGDRGGGGGGGSIREQPQPQQQQQQPQRRGYNVVEEEQHAVTFHRNHIYNNNNNNNNNDSGRDHFHESYHRQHNEADDYHRREDAGLKGRVGARPNRSRSRSCSGQGRVDEADSLYYGQPRSDNGSAGDIWECLECKTWNNALEVNRCTRCGTWAPRHHDERRPSRTARHGERDGWKDDDGDTAPPHPWKGGDDRFHRGHSQSSNNPSNNYNRREDDDTLDEFGRQKSTTATRGYDDDHDDDDAETNREKSKNNPGPQSHRPSRREWPPNFDTDSAMFMFDGRSGMFYEAESDFFYDPKTKLYYGNKQAAYFRYCGGGGGNDHDTEKKKNDASSSSSSTAPLFVPVTSASMTSTNTLSSSVIQVPENELHGAAPAVISRPSSSSDDRGGESLLFRNKAVSGAGGSMIAINLKTKALPQKIATSAATPATAGMKKKKAKLPSSSKNPSQSPSSLSSLLPAPPPPPPADPLQKKHAADMETWAGRMLEKQREETILSGTKPKCEVVPPSSSLHQQQERKEQALPLPPPPLTSKGEPICTLCQRKFPTLEKLRYHEKASNLHKENLAKKKRERERESTAMTAAAAASATAPTPVEKEYVDRAQQRRKMYSSDTISAAAAAAAATTMASSNMLIPFNTTQEPPPPLATVVRPEDTLGSSNVGHQMLQKLGWKSGSTTLGGGGSRSSSGAAGSETKNQMLLTKDWERIENIAAGRKDGRK